MSAPASVDEASLRRWLVERVAQISGARPAEVDPDRPLEEFGLSSRAAVALSGELEELLDRALPATLVWECPTIALLARRLAAADPARPDAVADAHSTDELSERSEPWRAAAAEPIAVVGIGCRFPGSGRGPRRLWEFLLAERNAVGQVPDQRWAPFDDGEPATAAVLARTTRHGAFLPDIAGFDAEFFGVTPREAALIDPQQRMLLEVAWEALEHAAIAPESLRGAAAGVFVGASGAEYGQLTGADLSRIDAWTGTGAALSVIANRLSYALDLRGPSMAVDTACSSSLVAVHLAAQSLRLGESDLALAGGVNLLLSPAVTVAFDQAGTMAPDGQCKTFDAAANGYVRGEGVGVVVLKRLADARRHGDRVLAVIRGGAVNSDDRSNGLMAPNPGAQEALLRAACQRAGVAPHEVDYVEAHGTGTLLGDPIEAGALGRALGVGRPAHEPLLVGSVKTNLGHLEAAAGIAGLIKVVLALAYRRIPASRSFHTPNPHIPFAELRLRVASSCSPWPRPDRLAVAGVSSFGFGGTNAHLVLQEAPGAPDPRPDPRPDQRPDARRGEWADGPADEPSARVYLLASVMPDRVRDSAATLAEHLAGPGAGVSLADLGHTLARRCRAGRSRAAVVARDRAGLLAGLSALAADQLAPGVVSGPAASGLGGRPAAQAARPPVWVFSGQGSQWAGMGRALLVESPDFAQAVDALDPLFEHEAGFSLRAALSSGRELRGVREVQPALFGMQVALAETWRAHGVQPGAVIGHSMGEAAAAVVAGALDVAAGLRVVAVRSRLAATLADAGGGMAVLAAPYAEAARLAGRHDGVAVAVHAAPNQTVVAGRLPQVREVIAEAEAAGRTARLVKVDFASHSPQVEPLLGELARQLSGLRPNAPATPWFSTVLPEPDAVPVADAAYWARNLRDEVRFAPAVAAAAQAGHNVFVEISPHPLLTGALAETLERVGVARPLVLSTLRRDADEPLTFLTQVATLWAHGLPLPADRFPGGFAAGRHVDLPTTPWRRRSHWFEARRAGAVHPPAGADAAGADQAGADPSGGADATSDKPGQSDWPGVAALPGLAPDVALRLLTERLRIRIGEVMGYPAARIGPATPLTELGLDSLMAARIANAARHDLDVALPVPPLLRGATLADAAALAADLLGLGAPAAPGTPAPPGVSAGRTPDQPAAPAVAPRDGAERLVLAVWTEIHDAEPTSVTAPLPAPDDATARRLADALADRAGVHVEPAALRAARTVEDLGQLLRQAQAAPGASPLRLLRAGEPTGPAPLFLFHPAGGDTGVYRQLAELLAADQTVYGLDRLADVREIDAKASRYLELIRERQPHGPYRLGGWSFGGFLAYEAARQLSLAGEPVETVALIDSLAPLPPPPISEREITLLRFRQFAQYLRETYGQPIELPYERLPELDEEGQIDTVLAVLAGSGALDGVAGQAILAHQKTSFLDLRAVERYAPATRHPGPVTLFRAAIAHQGIRDSRYQRHDETLGWDQIAGDGLRVETVPGHHLSVLDPPNVATLARRLDALLRRWAGAARPGSPGR